MQKKIFLYLLIFLVLFVQCGSKNFNKRTIVEYLLDADHELVNKEFLVIEKIAAENHQNITKKDLLDLKKKDLNIYRKNAPGMGPLISVTLNLKNGYVNFYCDRGYGAHSWTFVLYNRKNNSPIISMFCHTWYTESPDVMKSHLFSINRNNSWTEIKDNSIIPNIDIKSFFKKLEAIPDKKYPFAIIYTPDNIEKKIIVEFKYYCPYDYSKGSNPVIIYDKACEKIFKNLYYKKLELTWSVEKENFQVTNRILNKK